MIRLPAWMLEAIHAAERKAGSVEKSRELFKR
jgi:hypothetical protein